MPRHIGRFDELHARFAAQPPVPRTLLAKLRADAAPPGPIPGYNTTRHARERADAAAAAAAAAAVAATVDPSINAAAPLPPFAPYEPEMCVDDAVVSPDAPCFGRLCGTAGDWRLDGLCGALTSAGKIPNETARKCRQDAVAHGVVTGRRHGGGGARNRRAGVRSRWR